MLGFISKKKHYERLEEVEDYYLEKIRELNTKIENLQGLNKLLQERKDRLENEEIGG